MSMLQRLYQLQQQNIHINNDNVEYPSVSSSARNSMLQNPSFDTNISVKNCWEETETTELAMNQQKEIISTSMNHTTATQSTARLSLRHQAKAYTTGMVLGALIAGIALVIIIVLWQKSGPNNRVTTVTTTTTTSTSTTSSTSTTTSTTTTTTSTSTSSTSTTATTTRTSTSSTSTTATTTSTSTSSTSTTATTTSTSTSSTSMTTTTAPPWSLCVNGSDQNFTNNSFIYSPTSQNYAAGMLSNQLGVYTAYGYGKVTSTAIWTANQTTTSLPCLFALQTDRNLVVYAINTGNGTSVLWTAQIQNNGNGSPFCLQMLDTGNLVWIDNTQSIIWQSNSAVTSG